MTDKLSIQNTGDLIFYQTDDGQTRLEVRFANETIWMTQAQLAELFQKDKRTISEHINNIYNEEELFPESTIRNFRIVQNEGKREVEREISFYNLDVIISVGYRVKSHRGTKFRIWATERLREYLIKGFVMDDERLKQGGKESYFDELLERIRDIRSSEKIFWRKVLDIYETSIDYDPRLEISEEFFKVVQNKMHWAAHGHTAAEIIAQRADSPKPLMGLTSVSGKSPKRKDIIIAKNYLSVDELDTLNRIVTAYLEFAELQAKNRRPMYMKDWISKLDDFLRLSEREILTHAGKITHDNAVALANIEFDKFKKQRLEEKSQAEIDFEETINKLGMVEDNIKKVKTSRKKEL